MMVKVMSVKEKMQYFALIGQPIEQNYSQDKMAEIVNEHLKYLEKEFNNILFYGPKVGKRGGIIVIKATDLKQITDFCFNDPLVQAKLQTYEIIEFEMENYQTYIKDWL